MKKLLQYTYLVFKYSVPAWIMRFWFYFHCHGVLRTRPIQPHQDGVLIVSLVGRRDVLMYVVAAKSFYYYLQRGSFVVINDGSLTQRHIQIIKSHIRDIEIININDIDNFGYPKKGCWERLMVAVDYAQNNYVIVLDADTLTLSEVPEIIECINTNKSFIMSSGFTHYIRPMNEIWNEASLKYKNKDSDKLLVQSYVDSNLNKIENYKKLLYVKGTGGFNSYARGSISKKTFKYFYAELEAIFGKRWYEWGTEQIMACLLISNTPNAITLPFAKYPLYNPNNQVNYTKSSLVHFMGNYRFNKNFYINQTKRFIREFNRSSVES